MITASIQSKLDTLNTRFDELTELLSQPETITNQNLFRTLSQEHASLTELVNIWREYLSVVTEIEQARELYAEGDAEIQTMAEEELQNLSKQQAALKAQMDVLLLPKDPHDQSNIYLEIRAGTGGNEASLFTGDLLRMYTKYTEKKGWKLELLSVSEGEVGGYKEVICRVIGKHAYSRLKFESGAHRVQRVPDTESQGRIHTSACTVAVMAEPSEAEATIIDNKDLRIDTFRASGAGGQHVNKTDSAIRITHLPSGLVVECQQERSQHQNKARALAILQARLLDAENQKIREEHSAQRKNLVGSGDRSERIRTYNFPQGRITDHRINLTEYKLLQIMEGEIDIVIEPLIQEHQMEQMTQPI